MDHYYYDLAPNHLESEIFKSLNIPRIREYLDSLDDPLKKLSEPLANVSFLFRELRFTMKV
jgi:hypothetical protein